MQNRVIFFDHVRREVVTFEAGDEIRIAEMIELQRQQVATSGRPSAAKR